MFDLPMIADGTPFQRRVCCDVEGLPYGRTVTYGQMAGNLGGVRYARAVGAALAANPLLIVRPCTAWCPARGGLGGYRGGEDRKRALLFLEGINI
jgi:methylated-DNA-[protein]-cysteine S-methyltransferase